MAQQLKIEGGHALDGSIDISGAKNAVLPILAATLLCGEEVTVRNVPALDDVSILIRLLQSLGVELEYAHNQVHVRAQAIDSIEASYSLVKAMRASILVLGPLLARFGEAKVALPGGCAIGARPIDQHIKALKKLGAEIDLEEGFVHAKASRLHGARIVFDMVTVTGTENVLMAAVLAEGETVLENVAREPEVCDLARFLNAMGAKISGIGSDCLQIIGVAAQDLHHCDHSVLSDRIEAGTHLIAAAITGGRIITRNIGRDVLLSVLDKLQESGTSIRYGNDFIEADRRVGTINPVNIRTAPFPAFPTDLQAQFMALNTLATGSSTITETIFENRFMHVPELTRLGARINIEGNTAFVQGVSQLRGAPVTATDLRASACLILAGLAAQGTSYIEHLEHLDRGYDGIEEKLNAVGANIERIDVQENHL